MFRVFKKDNKIHPSLNKPDKDGVYGCVDYINEEGIGGWLLHINSTEPQVVQVRINGVPVAEKVTSIPRNDISAIIGRPANCGFYIKWSEIAGVNLWTHENFKLEIFDKLTGRVISEPKRDNLNFKLSNISKVNNLSMININPGQDDLKVIESLFDEEWYRRNYPEVDEELQTMNITAFEHYLKIGGPKGYSPNHWFDEEFYRSFYEDVDALVEDRFYLTGLEHFIKKGRFEQRIPKKKSFDILNYKFNYAISPSGLERWKELDRKLSYLSFEYTHLDKPRLNFIVPTMDRTIMFGGYISLLEFIKRVLKMGINIRVLTHDDHQINEKYFYYNIKDIIDVKRYAKQIEFQNIIKDPTIEIGGKDRFFAYSAFSALIAHNMAKNTEEEKIIYLIQEDERVFYSNNSFKAMIDYIYSLPMVAIFNTRDLMEYFKKNKIGSFGNDETVSHAYYFEPVITQIELEPYSQTRLKNKKSRRLLFYARPEIHAERNLFEFGYLGLKKAIEKGYFDNRWKFDGIGSAKDYKIEFGNGKVLNIKAKMTLDEYKKALLEYDVGLFLMYAPHPGLVGFEMASAGMIVVVNKFDYRDENYFSEKSKNFVVAELHPDSISEKLRIAVEMSENYPKRIQNAYIPKVRDWDEVFSEDFIREVLKVINM